MLTYELLGSSLSLVIPFDGDCNLTKELLSHYDNFNKKTFDKDVLVDYRLCDFVNIVYGVFGQEAKKMDIQEIDAPRFTLSQKKSVVLGFSGGLDSAYHALRLKDMGYTVYLVHLSGLNSYENNNAEKSAVEFSQQNDFELIIVKVKKNAKNKMFWTENPIKNQLIQAICIDFAISKGIDTIGLGDDYSMSFSRPDFILGTNTTDCREIQAAFESFVSQYMPSLRFKMIERPIGSDKENKLIRIQKLAQHNSLNLYYSCVGAGRFNQYNRAQNIAKYNISLPQYNCGCSCAKCAMHNLLMHYGKVKEYPQDFVDACWDRLWKTKHGNISALFAPNISLSERINNLFTY